MPRLRCLFEYFLRVTNTDFPAAVAVLKPLGTKETEMGMTTAERLINEGRAEGKAEALLSLLRARFAGEVDDGVEARVRAADIPTLDRWTERVLPFDKLEDVLD